MITIIIAYVVVIFIIAHLAYEGIVAPTLRLRIKFALFTLRDRAFRVHLESSTLFPREEYDLFLDSINGVMKYIDDMGITYLILFKKFASEEMKNRALRRARTFKESKCSDVRNLAEALEYQVEMLVAINSLSLFVTILPFALLVLRVRNIIRALAFRGNRGEGELAIT